MAEQIIDVREPDEYAESHVAGARNIPLGLILDDQINPALDPAASYVVYCRRGIRAQSAMDALVARGFAHMRNGINQDSLEAEQAHE